MIRRRPGLGVVALAAACLAAAACGGSLTDEEILAASGATGSVLAGGPGAEASGTEASDAGSGAAGSGVDGSTAGTAPVAAAGRAAGTANAGGPPAGGERAAVGTPGETGPIVIGSVGNYSGPAGSAQAGIPRAVQVWAASTNASGGLFGREVQVIVVDDGGDPARYASAVQDLVENRDVVAFVGQGASVSMDGGIGYLNRVGVPVIGTDCSRNEWFAYPVFFPQCPTFAAQIPGIVRAGVQITGKRRFGYVSCAEAASCSGGAEPMRQAAEAAGAQLVYHETVSLTQIDFTAQCRNAQQADVELMFVGADPNTLARFARSCDRQGFRPQYVQASISVTADSASLPGLGRVAVSLPVFPFQGASGSAEIDEYRQAMERFSGSSPGPAESFGWASAKLFELAATKAAATSQSVSPQTLIAALRTVSGETLGGLTVPLDFTASTPRPAACYFVAQGDGAGGWSAPLGIAPQCF